MIESPKRKAVMALHQGGMGAREIARRLRMGRNTVRRIIRNNGRMPSLRRDPKQRIDEDLLRTLYADCEGWVQRVHEKLIEEHGIHVPYSTLTRRLRQLKISAPVKERCGSVPDNPGEEMQHDTSPYEVTLGEKKVRVVASLLYLRYSKRRYVKFYPVFNRFKMKCFFHEGLTFWEYCARFCIIDNTSLARLRGTGKNALIVPEMEQFSHGVYGFEFRCHEVGHANRKAGDERAFYTLESNFFPGRRFSSLEDLNAQAFEWATVRMEHRRQGNSRLIPAKAFEHERRFLIRLPAYLPEPYEPHERGTDQYGYVAFDGNYFWVPGTQREDLRVLEYAQRLELYRARQLLITYPLPGYGVKNKRIYPQGRPPPRHQPNNRRKPTAEEEKHLRCIDPAVGAYLDFALKPKGIVRHRFVRNLFALSRRLIPSVFIKVVMRAHRFTITDIRTIERIAAFILREGDVSLPPADLDETFRQRESYREGYLTDPPNLSHYDLFDEEDENE